MSRPLIRHLHKEKKDLKFIVSFYSPSGFERINLDSNLFLKIYLPLDIKAKQLEYLKIARPKAFIFIKYDTNL